MDVEAKIASNTVRRVVFVGPVVIGAAALFAGGRGAFAATVGVVLVAANFLLSGWILSTAARISPGAYHAAALIGFVLRFALLTVTMIGVLALIDLDRVTFAIATVATYLVLLVWETVKVSRGSERELEWTR